MPGHRRRLRIGVLASGEGTTLQDLLDACAQRTLQAQVVVVISNNRESGAIRRAAAAAIPVFHLSASTHPDPGRRDRAMLRSLQGAEAQVVTIVAPWLHRSRCRSNKAIRPTPSLRVPRIAVPAPNYALTEN